MIALPAALACLSCSGEIGRQVRDAVFGPDFGSNLVLTLLPIPVLLGIVAAIRFGRPAGRGRRSTRDDA